MEKKNEAPAPHVLPGNLYAVYHQPHLKHFYFNSTFHGQTETDLTGRQPVKPLLELKLILMSKII
eukprot:1152078-Pelagomonas_calceolata.AAC.3